MAIHNDRIEEEAKLLVDQAVRLREEALLSQKQVATILGLSSHGSINAIETKKVMPRMDTFLRLLSVYGYQLQIVPKENREDPCE